VAKQAHGAHPLDEVFRNLIGAINQFFHWHAFGAYKSANSSQKLGKGLGISDHV
jgi:hypothetical protein